METKNQKRKLKKGMDVRKASIASNTKNNPNINHRLTDMLPIDQPYGTDTVLRISRIIVSAVIPATSALA